MGSVLPPLRMDPPFKVSFVNLGKGTSTPPVVLNKTLSEAALKRYNLIPDEELTNFGRLFKCVNCDEEEPLKVCIGNLFNMCKSCYLHFIKSNTITSTDCFHCTFIREQMSDIDLDDIHKFVAQLDKCADSNHGQPEKLTQDKPKFLLMSEVGEFLFVDVNGEPVWFKAGVQDMLLKCFSPLLPFSLGWNKASSMANTRLVVKGCSPSDHSRVLIRLSYNLREFLASKNCFISVEDSQSYIITEENHVETPSSPKEVVIKDGKVQGDTKERYKQVYKLLFNTDNPGFITSFVSGVEEELLTGIKPPVSFTLGWADNLFDEDVRLTMTNKKDCSISDDCVDKVAHNLRAYVFVNGGCLFIAEAKDYIKVKTLESGDSSDSDSDSDDSSYKSETSSSSSSSSDSDSDSDSVSSESSESSEEEEKKKEVVELTMDEKFKKLTGLLFDQSSSGVIYSFKSNVPDRLCVGFRQPCPFTLWWDEQIDSVRLHLTITGDNRGDWITTRFIHNLIMFARANGVTLEWTEALNYITIKEVKEKEEEKAKPVTLVSDFPLTVGTLGKLLFVYNKFGRPIALNPGVSDVILNGLKTVDKSEIQVSLKGWKKAGSQLQIAIVGRGVDYYELDELKSQVYKNIKEFASKNNLVVTNNMIIQLVLFAVIVSKKPAVKKRPIEKVEVDSDIDSNKKQKKIGDGSPVIDLGVWCRTSGDEKVICGKCRYSMYNLYAHRDTGDLRCYKCTSDYPKKPEEKKVSVACAWCHTQSNYLTWDDYACANLCPSCINPDPTQPKQKKKKSGACFDCSAQSDDLKWDVYTGAHICPECIKPTQLKKKDEGEWKTTRSDQKVKCGDCDWMVYDHYVNSVTNEVCCPTCRHIQNPRNAKQKKKKKNVSFNTRT